MDTDKRDGFLLILLSAMGYAFLPVFARLLYREGMEPFDVVVWRFLIATPIIWLIIYLRRTPPPDEPLPRWKLLGLGLLFSFAGIAAFVGLGTDINASTYVVLFFAHPAMVAVAEALMGKKLPLMAWVALLLTVVGVMLTAPDFREGFAGENSSLLGVVIAMFNAIVVAIYIIVSERVMHGQKSMARASAYVITGTLGIMAVVVAVNGLNIPLSPLVWAYLIGLGAICTALPIFAINTGIQKLGASNAAITSTMEPVLAVLLAVLLLGETLAPVQIIGGMLILSSVLLLQIGTDLPERTAEVILGGE